MNERRPSSRPPSSRPDSSPKEARPPEPPKVIQKVDPKQLAHFVTTIKTAEQQVGENIINALRHDETVAVLTTVVMGPDGQQRVVSAALNPKLMAEVQKLLIEASQEREEEEPCVGFHCLVKPKPSGDADSPPGTSTI